MKISTNKKSPLDIRSGTHIYQKLETGEVILLGKGIILSTKGINSTTTSLVIMVISPNHSNNSTFWLSRMAKKILASGRDIDYLQEYLQHSGHAQPETLVMKLKVLHEVNRIRSTTTVEQLPPGIIFLNRTHSMVKDIYKCLEKSLTRRR